MSDKPTNPAEINPEELLKQVEAAVAFVEKSAAQGRKQFAYNIKLAEDRLAYAESQLAEVKAAREKLAEAFARSQQPPVEEPVEEPLEEASPAEVAEDGEPVAHEEEAAPEAETEAPAEEAIAPDELTAIVAEAAEPEAEETSAEAPEAEAAEPVVEIDPADYEAEMARLQTLMMVFGTTRRMMTIEIACHKHNLAQMDFNPKRPPTELNLRNPALDANYMEARAYLDVNLAVLLVKEHLDGVDLVLRATGGQPAVVPKSDEELAARQDLADELKAAMSKDKDLLILANQMGSELLELLALLEWGQGTLPRLDTVLPEARRSMLEDEDWARLNGRVAYLQTIAERVAPYPLLAECFPIPEAFESPYAPVEWEPTLASKTAPVGTGRLTLSQLAQQQGTGRLSGTGRLPGGTGRLNK